MVRRRIQLGLLTFVLVVVAAAFATAPPTLVNEAAAPSIDGDLDTWLARSERAAGLTAQLIPDAEKRIRWFDHHRGSRTRHAVVYLHGFSATRQEIAPVAERVAEELGANLFETRLSGHGQLQNPLAGVRAEDWLNDAAEALAIGAMIGEEIILMGTSTGATLALAMAGHASFDQVGYLVLLSPNFAPSDTSSEFLTWPGGPQLAYMVAGDTHSWTPRNDLQARYWSTAYPMDAVIEMMRLVKYVRGMLPLRLDQAVLVLFSPEDTVVDTDWIRSGFDQLQSPRRRLLEITSSGDPSHHLLAGDIMSPENNQAVAESIVSFVNDPGD